MNPMFNSSGCKDPTAFEAVGHIIHEAKVASRAEQHRTQQKKTPTYNYTEADIQKKAIEYINAELPAIRRKIRDQTFEEVNFAVKIVIAQTLYDMYNHKQKRIMQFLNRMDCKMQCIAEQRVTLTELQQWCDENKIDVGGTEYYGTSRHKH